MLGLADDALSKPVDGLITRPNDEVIMFVRLWQHEVLVGPRSFLDHVGQSDRDGLVHGSQLLALSSRWGGRLLGAATLAFRDAYLELDPQAAPSVTDDPAAVRNLAKACPPDDVAEVGLADMDRAIVTLDEFDRRLLEPGTPSGSKSLRISGC